MKKAMTEQSAEFALLAMHSLGDKKDWFIL